MDIPEWMEEDSLKSLLESLYVQSNQSGDARIRLTIFRSGYGRFTPTSNEATAIASIEHVDGNGFELNDKGIAIGLYQISKKHRQGFQTLKPTFQLYVQAGNYAAEQGLGDVLILNDFNQLIEATSSNIFLVLDGALHTPKLEAGPVGGVMRAAVINLALKLGVKVYECNLEAHELIKADKA